MTEAQDNLTRQADEIEALLSIYNSSFKTEDEANRSYSIIIEEKDIYVTLFFKFSEKYPSQEPPTYQLSAPWLKGLQRIELCGSLEDIYLENIGETVIFQWVEKLRELLQTLTPLESEEKTFNEQDGNKLSEPVQLLDLNTNAPQDCEADGILITHGEPINDRKSTFQGHTAVVKSQQDVKSVLHTLYSNKKIANATHNIYAYRINRAGTNSFLQDCVDDGETQAGGRLLHLLQILDISDVLVVVTRWYGHIHLGPDRFRHINNAARQVLQKAQLLPLVDSKAKATKK